jgi:hypothetical protein
MAIPRDMNDVNSLKFGSLHVTPTHFDWSAPQDDDGDGWSSTEATRHTDDQGRERILIVRDGSVTQLWDNGKLYESYEAQSYLDDHWVYPDTDEDSDNPPDGDLDPTALDAEEFDALFGTDVEGADGPQMNYWYECEYLDSDNAAAAAVAIVDLPLCIVEIDGRWGFALTGGGMDLTWEIVEAYVQIGLLPPVYYARDLPGMAGRGNNEKDQMLAAACLRSLTAAAESLNRDAERLREMAATWTTHD